MNATQKAISFCVGVMLVLTSLSIFVPHLSDIRNGFEKAESPYAPLVRDDQIPLEPSTEGEQIVSQLYEVALLDFPIVVDGVVFQTDQDVLVNLSVVDVLAKYHKKIERDSDGTIKRLLFTKEV